MACSPTTVLPAPVGAQTTTLLPSSSAWIAACWKGSSAKGNADAATSGMPIVEESVHDGAAYPEDGDESDDGVLDREVFGDDWERNGDGHPGPAGSAEE